MSQARPFKDRLHAGKQLALALHDFKEQPGAIVLALPRGGVPVGFAVARELKLPLDVLVVRKLGLPGHEEFAIGAVGSGGIRVVQPDVLDDFGITPPVLEALCAREMKNIEQRERLFRGGRPAPELRGRTVILVDDGLATGSTMRAAIAVVQAAEAGRIIVAVPVGAPDSCAALAPEVDELVCLEQPPSFHAVSQFYRHFDQTDDSEVQDLLAQAWSKQPQPAVPE